MTYDELILKIQNMEINLTNSTIIAKALLTVIKLHEPSPVSYGRGMESVLECFECNTEGIRYPCDTISSIIEVLNSDTPF